MLNKVLLEGILAQQPVKKYAANGKPYCLLIVICKIEQMKAKDDGVPVPIFNDDIIPVMVFNEKLIDYLVANRKPCDVLSIEGTLKTPNRSVLVQARYVKLIKSGDFTKMERKIRDEILDIRNEKKKEEEDKK